MRLIFWITLLFFALIGCTQVGASLLQGSDPAAAIFLAPGPLPAAIQQMALPVKEGAEQPVIEIHIPAVESQPHTNTNRSFGPNNGNQVQQGAAGHGFGEGIGEGFEDPDQSQAAQDPSPPQQVAPPVAPACIPDLIFLEDLTIPDGTVVAPGSELDKRWQVKNNGTCDWDQEFRLHNVNDQAMGAPGEQALYPARRGSEAMIRIRFTAPADPGPHRSVWQAFTPDGEPFGDTFYVHITVEGP